MYTREEYNEIKDILKEKEQEDKNQTNRKRKQYNIYSPTSNENNINQHRRRHQK